MTQAFAGDGGESLYLPAVRHHLGGAPWWLVAVLVIVAIAAVGFAWWRSK